MLSLILILCLLYIISLKKEMEDQKIMFEKLLRSKEKELASAKGEIVALFEKNGGAKSIIW
jgi:hypothetical protein